MKRTAALCLLLASARASHEWSSGDDASANTTARAHNLTLPLSLSKAYTHYATALRAHLLADYDKGVPPSSERDGTSNSYAGADVSMAIRFFKVESVHAADGRMTLKVWLRMSWVDERLSWDPAEWGGVDQLQFMGSSLPAGAEVTEIWLPDIQPYNAYTGIHASLDPVHAMVSSSGSVFYSRPGMLDIMCKFSGLAAFPYDTLKCALEFGGWAMSAYHQGIRLMGEGFSFSSQEATAGSSYQEYSIQKIECEMNTYFYPCCADEPWPVATYRVFLNRSSYYYTMLIVVPSILITLMSFAVFYTQPEACDALAYGITVVLASELMKIVLVEVLPVCGETVWIELFSQVNSFFCVFALTRTLTLTLTRTLTLTLTRSTLSSASSPSSSRSCRRSSSTRTSRRSSPSGSPRPSATSVTSSKIGGTPSRRCGSTTSWHCKCHLWPLTERGPPLPPALWPSGCPVTASERDGEPARS